MCFFFSWIQFEHICEVYDNTFVFLWIQTSMKIHRDCCIKNEKKINFDLHNLISSSVSDRKMLWTHPKSTVNRKIEDTMRYLCEIVRNSEIQYSHFLCNSLYLSMKPLYFSMFCWIVLKVEHFLNLMTEISAQLRI